MLKSLVFCGLSAFYLFFATASNAEICDSYSVVPGDTLRLISERYYGTRELSPTIYNANITIVGDNPNAIEIGMMLEIPCRDGMQMPEPTAFLALVSTENDANLAPTFFAKAGATPFMGRDSSGLLPDILAAALHKGGYAGSLDITRTDSTSDMLQASTQPGAMLAFPWVMPECGVQNALSPQSAYLCENYTFSDPLYEVTLGIFTHSDSPLIAAESPAAFAGSTICVPQFHTDDLLRANGIIGARDISVNLVPDIATCLDGLTNGTYDAMVADYQSIKEFSPEEARLVDVPAFAKTTTLHAVAYSMNPAALDVLEMTNAGLKQILSSGEWFGIVNQHLATMSN